jgi:hypothetical protein
MARRIPAPQIRESALRETKEKIYTSPSEFKKRFEGLLRQEGDEVTGWLDWGRHGAWVEHLQNFGTLVDEHFIPEIALLLNMGENDVEKLHKETSRRSIVEALSKQNEETDFYKDVLNCFLVAAMLRGMYHDNIAQGSRRQVAHHPIRWPFLPDLPTEPLLFDASMTEGLLATLVLHDALSEKKLDDRLSRWAEKIAKIRDANRRGDEIIDLRPKENPNLALRGAVDAAKKVGIYVIPRKLEYFLPKVFGVGTGKVVECVLTPFIGMPATIHGEVVEAYAEDLSRKGLRELYGRHCRLAKLAKSPPGRLSIYRRIFPI